MDEQSEITQAVTGAAKDIEGKKKLACTQAFELADRFNLPLSRIGEVCNDNDIKICSCQLGCFK